MGKLHADDPAHLNSPIPCGSSCQETSAGGHLFGRTQKNGPGRGVRGRDGDGKRVTRN